MLASACDYHRSSLQYEYHHHHHHHHRHHHQQQQHTQSEITYSKLRIETLEQGVKYVQS